MGIQPQLCLPFAGGKRFPNDGDRKIRKVETRKLAIEELGLQQAATIKTS